VHIQHCPAEFKWGKCQILNADDEIGTPGYYVVCEYYPAGNVVGSGKTKNVYFQDNVKKQIKGKITDTVESGVSSSASRVTDLSSQEWIMVALGVIALGLIS
jgi:hypothetical protein